MHTDTLTRLLLVGILLCLIVLVAQGFGSGSASGIGGWGRYQVMGMRAGTPVLIRTDTVTGEVWKLELRGGRDRWVELTEREEEADERDTAQAEPAPPSRLERPDPTPTVAVETTPPRPAAPPPRPAATDPRARNGPRAAAPDFTTLANAVRRSQLPRDIRVWAVSQLAGSEDPESTDVLLEALEDEDARVVAAAVTALGPRDDDRVQDALDAVRSNPDPAVQAALEALDSGGE